MTAKSAEATSEEEWTSLGTCHYGGDDEEATVMAARADGTGWIAVCDRHTGDGKKGQLHAGELTNAGHADDR